MYYPILYPYSETTFGERGIGALSDCVSCIVTEELNGGYTLELKYPKNGVHQENLLVRNIIVAQPNKYKDREAFRIYKVDRRLKDYITVYANQLSYDLSGYVAYLSSGYVTSWSLNVRESAPSGTIIKVIYENDAFLVLGSLLISGVTWIQIKLEDGTVGWCDSIYTQIQKGASSLAGAIKLLNLCSGDFTLSTDKTSSTAFNMEVISSVRSWFGGKEGSLIDVYGGEWGYDFFNCNLLTARGSDTGLRISYGVNLAEYIRQNEDNIYSHVMAYYASNDEAGNLTEAHGDEVATGATSIHRTLLINVTSEYQNGTVPTSAQLTTYATNYVTAHRSELVGDSVTITVTPEILNTQEISLGDTVHVIYNDEMITTRVIKTVWNAVADKYTSVILGTKKANIAQTIKSLQTNITPTEVVVDNALNSASTHPVQNKVIKTALDGKADAVKLGLYRHSSGYSGAGDINSITNYMYNYAVNNGLIGYWTVCRCDPSSNSVFGNTGGFDMFCRFSSANYGYGFMMADNASNMAVWRRTGRSNYACPMLLNSAIIQYPTLSKGSNYSNGGNTCYYLVGNRVHVHISVQGLTANANNTIFTLPSGYRPKFRIVGAGTGTTMSATDVATVNIYADGNINVRSNSQYAFVDIEYDLY